MQTVIMVLGIGVFAAIAYGDVRSRRIANELSIAIAGLGLARIALAGEWSAAAHTLAAAAVVFAVALAMFWRGWLGGGDAKLLPAAALLVGYHDLLGFLVVMSLCCGVIALAVLTASKLGGPRRHLSPSAVTAAAAPPAPPARPSVPYGVAIALAGVLILVLQSSVPR
ncbi:MAG TPA: prepilin peptidase [Stellaceae bacterium]|nr:prepilin peptidase [Stellaceae bacterium]